ncbi:aminoacetone oxidase family FAD-binding enzyme [Sulfurovum sp.]|jgi:predicted Rossmann fold flavoprotein|uniref:NAD(P)/FAD-dependent oxidoreductase n=1 Tax=Sulfurovum sp. TaxID=1969726 RepID=UPI002A371F27|nr:aminoacetone oxidase family FAD-binding enzyme [Sulfurovum sp.]MDD2451752.1 aminoacetone oxidase family FAD-binding enzyme [Sulfurovum sp.]MDD3500292.1 aminoacetone oxidase family FAD-binding enzyme [Sulfurovum sp.]MDY0401971.1 aminoacetone oxidase family FAD-binding enzyme [Sulfurovum sp.]
MNPIVIIGGGASALMLASLLPSSRATIIEANAKTGAKIQVSGGGKCNITNQVMDPAYFLGEEYFIQPALDLFDETMLLEWLKKRGLEPVIRKGTQYFCPNSSKEILEIFQRECSKQKLLLGEQVIGVTKKGKGFEVKTDRRTLSAERVVVASGGLSYPQLNASDIGYRIAESFGHTIIKTTPALVGMTLQPEQFFFKELSGASTEVRITVGERVVEGSLLFAHKGISGPAVLNASLYWEKGKIEIDFLPAVDWDAFVRSEKNISSLLPMPKRVTKAFLLQLGLQDKPGKKLASSELEQLKSLCHYSFAPAGTFGYAKAEVTKGGVATDEVNAYTMMSEKEEGLYFIGEVLDVTGRLGGYNFQWAFSSAYICYQHLMNT